MEYNRLEGLASAYKVLSFDSADSMIPQSVSTSDRHAWALRLLETARMGLRPSKIDSLRQHCVEAHARLKHSLDIFSSVCTPVDSFQHISLGVDKVLDGLTKYPISLDRHDFPLEVLQGLLDSVLLFRQELLRVESVDDALTDGLTVRQLLNLIAEGCLAQDLARNGPLNFAAGFLLDACPDILTGSLGQGVSLLTAVALYRLIFCGHERNVLESRLQDLEERVGWIVALDWLSENLTNDKQFMDLRTRIGDLIAAEIVDRLNLLEHGERVMIPLGWMTHAILGVITVECPTYSLSLINPGTGSLTWHQPALEPFSSYPKVDIDFTVSGASLSLVTEYLRRTIHLSSRLRTLPDQSVEAVRKEAIHCHYAYWENASVNRVRASGRSKVQRSPTCGIEVFKKLNKFFNPKNASHLNEKMFVLTLFWPWLVDVGISDVAKNEVKATLVKTWMLSVSNKITAQCFARLTQDMLNNSFFLGKVVNRAFTRLSNEGCLEGLENLINNALKIWPDMAFDCVVQLIASEASESVVRLAAKVLEAMAPQISDSNSKMTIRTGRWLDMFPQMLSHKELWENWTDSAALSTWNTHLDVNSK